MGKEQRSPKGSVWAEVTDDPALSSAAKLALATLQAASVTPVGTNRIIDTGALQDPAAQAIAAGVGRFLKVEAHQIVAGSADFEEAVVKKLWSQIVTAREGVFDKLQANKIDTGTMSGQIISGATIQTAGNGRGRVVMDSNGLRLVAADGSTDRFKIDAASGDVNIKGSIYSNDEWSYATWSDVTENRHDGTRYGMGLVFNRTNRPLRLPGGIFLKQNEKGELQTVVAPPSEGYWNTGQLTLGNRHFGWGGDFAAFKVATDEIDMQVNSRRLEFRIGQGGISLKNDLNETRMITAGQRGEAYFHAGSSNNFNGVVAAWSFWHITSIGGGKNLGYAYGDNGGAYLWSRSGGNYAWIHGDGFTSTGKTKKFSMHVPKMSEARDGELLQHKCTESPFDGIEYWNVVALDSAGEATWELPDYVPAIASRKAPWCVFTSAEHGASSARLEKGDDRFRVHVSGEPGASVSVLVKGARIVEIEGAAGGVSKWQDFGDGLDVWSSDLPPSPPGEPPFEPHRSGEIVW
jgi:hypothetical protein